MERISVVGGVPATCRANSRRGATSSTKRSYPPVKSVRRALNVLTTLNRLRIASLGDLHEETGLPKSTIVRMLDTLIADGYVIRDNLCGGYRVTHKVRGLDAGYDGIAEVLEASQVFAVELTERIKWPVGIGVLDGDAMAVHFWTGPISPWVHVNTLLGNRPKLLTSAMGRAWLAFCPAEERDQILARMRATAPSFGETEEAAFRALLERVRDQGYAQRAPYTEPRRNTTIALPIRHLDTVLASMTVSFFTSAVPVREVAGQIIAPLRATVGKIEKLYACMHASRDGSVAGMQETELAGLGIAL
jgi:IclR family transcriptional regulator, mhp operon transcriptional activator